MKLILKMYVFFINQFFVKTPQPYYLAPTGNIDANATRYYAKNHWPQFDFEHNNIAIVNYRNTKATRSTSLI